MNTVDVMALTRLRYIAKEKGFYRYEVPNQSDFQLRVPQVGLT
mgnify:CR=1 FL=1